LRHGVDESAFVLWTEVSVHVIDFEGSLLSGVVEYGVATLVDGSVDRVATRLCRPRGRIRPGEAAVHGLADADVAQSEPFESEWNLFAGLRETGVFAAHFSATENSLLRSVWPTPRLSPDFLRPDGSGAEWGPWIDTGRMAAGGSVDGQSLRLEEVVRRLGLTASLDAAADAWCPPLRRKFHCALYDALACALVLDRLARDAGGAAWTLRDALAASTGDVRVRDSFRQGELF
jgi:DNA polymerase-3 subunit epsilon